MNSFFDTVEQYINLNDELRYAIIQCATFHRFEKKQLLHKAGTICEQLHFIIKGAARCYYHQPDGKEITCYFAFENNFITAIDSFFSHGPGILATDALEPTETFSISKQSLHALYNRFHEMEKLGRLITEKEFSWLLNRSFAQQFTTAEEKYQQLLHNSPQIFLRVPLGHIASFLGISQETLSRIRAKKEFLT
jgi:CRP/FNR family transcriptional regulator, anaerobic regulatory protein